MDLIWENEHLLVKGQRQTLSSYKLSACVTLSTCFTLTA